MASEQPYGRDDGPGPVADPTFWSGKRVLLTGHTGFKGAWLGLWLQRLGAVVVGYALPQPDPRALFHRAGVAKLLTSIEGDVRDADHVARVVTEQRPEIVIHMAAQALVRYSYLDPLETYATNVMGTAHILDAVRRSDATRMVLSVTSDKCYENHESARPFVEDDAMGGADPYSSSKGAAELVTSAYRRSYFPPERADEHGVAVASARAGNVIGGGDWAQDRLVVDVMSSFLRGETPVLRNPRAIRPWQFVLEPLAGYLRLVERAYTEPSRFASGWNFGPDERDCRPVAWLVERMAKEWSGELGADAGVGRAWRLDEVPAVHEAQLLRLDAGKARRELGWQPRLPLEDAVDWTVEWYRAFQRGDELGALASNQLDRYQSLAATE